MSSQGETPDAVYYYDWIFGSTEQLGHKNIQISVTEGGATQYHARIFSVTDNAADINTIATRTGYLYDVDASSGATSGSIADMIKDALDIVNDGTYGNAALKTLLDGVDTDLTNIENKIDALEVAKKPEPVAQFGAAVKIIQFADRNILESQGLESVGPVIAVQHDIVFLDDNRILETGQVFELEDQLLGGRGDHFFVAEEGRYRHDFKGQLEFFGIDGEHVGLLLTVRCFIRPKCKSQSP